MFVAWTHTPCGTRNDRAIVDRCDGCGAVPRSVPEVVQHSAPVPPGPLSGDPVLPPERRADDLPVSRWEDAPDEVLRPPDWRTVR